MSENNNETIEDSELIQSVILEDDKDDNDSDDNLDDIKDDSDEDEEESESEEEDDLTNDNETINEDIIQKLDCVYDSELIDSLKSEEKESNEEIKVPNDERITNPILTKYERVRILGVRAKQIASGAKIMVKINNKEVISPMEIAKIELIYLKFYAVKKM